MASKLLNGQVSQMGIISKSIMELRVPICSVPDDGCTEILSGSKSPDLG